MSNQFVMSTAGLHGAIANAMRALQENESVLQQLDAAVGDGDLGFTVVAGARSVLERIESLTDETAKTLLVEAGKAFNRAASSTFGTLFSAALISAGKTGGEKKDLTLNDLSLMLGAAIDIVQQRGRAKLGDKTFLDVLIPVHQALNSLAGQERTLADIAAQLVMVADDALQQSAALEAKAGRASYAGERSKGVKDPGGAAICVVIKSFAETLTDS
jgi:phosphoenolpyruvate---glycerone phosphotransferase subunit DhaL